MGFSVLTVAACALFAGAWIAVSVGRYRLTARRKRERAEWARLTGSVSGLAELDAGLDRARGNEQEWIRRYR
jgi:hypothetical protein